MSRRVRRVRSSSNKRMVIIIVVAVIALAAVGVFLFRKSRAPKASDDLKEAVAVADVAEPEEAEFSEDSSIAETSEEAETAVEAAEEQLDEAEESEVADTAEEVGTAGATVDTNEPIDSTPEPELTEEEKFQQFKEDVERHDPQNDRYLLYDLIMRLENEGAPEAYHQVVVRHLMTAPTHQKLLYSGGEGAIVRILNGFVMVDDKNAILAYQDDSCLYLVSNDWNIVSTHGMSYFDEVDRAVVWETENPVKWVLAEYKQQAYLMYWITFPDIPNGDPVKERYPGETINQVKHTCVTAMEDGEICQEDYNLLKAIELQTSMWALDEVWVKTITLEEFQGLDTTNINMVNLNSKDGETKLIDPDKNAIAFIRDGRAIKVWLIQSIGGK